MSTKPIYTHDEAALIVELFENVLDYSHIKVPSPEKNERLPDNTAALYGSSYSDLLDSVEEHLLYILNRHTSGAEVVQGRFSGII